MGFTSLFAERFQSKDITQALNDSRLARSPSTN